MSSKLFGREFFSEKPQEYFSLHPSILENLTLIPKSSKTHKHKKIAATATRKLPSVKSEKKMETTGAKKKEYTDVIVAVQDLDRVPDDVPSSPASVSSISVTTSDSDFYDYEDLDDEDDQPLEIILTRKNWPPNVTTTTTTVPALRSSAQRIEPTAEPPKKKRTMEIEITPVKKRSEKDLKQTLIPTFARPAQVIIPATLPTIDTSASEPSEPEPEPEPEQSYSSSSSSSSSSSWDGSSSDESPPSSPVIDTTVPSTEEPEPPLQSAAPFKEKKKSKGPELEVEKCIPRGEAVYMQHHKNKILSMSINPVYPTLLASASTNDEKLLAFTKISVKDKIPLSADPITYSDAELPCLSIAKVKWSPDGKSCALLTKKPPEKHQLIFADFNDINTPQKTKVVMNAMPHKPHIKPPLDCTFVGKRSDLVISGGQDKQLILWNKNEKSVTKLKHIHTSYITSVYCNTDELYLYSGGSDKRFLKMDIAAATVVTQYKFQERVTGIRGHPTDNNQFVVAQGQKYNQLNLVDTRTKKFRTMSLSYDVPVSSDVAGDILPNWSPDGNLISCGGYRTYINLWDIRYCRTMCDAYNHKLPNDCRQHRPTQTLKISLVASPKVYEAIFHPYGMFVTNSPKGIEFMPYTVKMSAKPESELETTQIPESDEE